MGVKIAHALGAEVSVLGHSLNKQDEAKKMGADKFYASSLNGQESFDELKGYFDLIINTLSVGIDWNLYLNLLALDGTMVVVGLPEKETLLSASSLIGARRCLAGSVIGGIRETQEMLDFCSKHNITSDIELIPIQKVNDAYP
jgi:alcohol dehydrogenase (NADP+)